MVYLDADTMLENNFDNLVLDCSISIANAQEILQSCTKASIYSHVFHIFFCNCHR